MRSPLGLVLATTIVLLAGCIASPVQPASVADPLAGLRVPQATDVVNLTGHLTLPSNGMAILPGQAEEQPLEVPADALRVRFNLTWSTLGPTPETSDLDLYIFDGDGEQVGQAASLSHPEQTQVRVTSKVVPGTWTVRVVNFNNPETDWALTAEVVR